MLCLRNSVVRNQTISYRKYHEIAEKARKMSKQLEKDTNIWYNVGVKLRKHTKPRCANMSNLIIQTTLIISKKPGNTGISRDIRTEFTTDLLLSD